MVIIKNQLIYFNKMSKKKITQMVNNNYKFSKKFSEESVNKKIESFWKNLKRN